MRKCEAALKHECHEGTNDTNFVRNDRASFVSFVIQICEEDNLCQMIGERLFAVSL